MIEKAQGTVYTDSMLSQLSTAISPARIGEDLNAKFASMESQLLVLSSRIALLESRIPD